jgi:hypothetical protein
MSDVKVGMYRNPPASPAPVPTKYMKLLSPKNTSDFGSFLAMLMEAVVACAV